MKNRFQGFIHIFTRRSGRRSVRYFKTVLAVLILIVATVTIPIPGPWSTPIFIAGLAILASEYDSFNDFKNRLEDEGGRVWSTVKEKFSRSSPKKEAKNKNIKK